MLGSGKASEGMRAVFVAQGALLLLGVALSASAVDPAERTADLPDSWLVLYNSSDADSTAWAAWYQQQRGIPDDHMVGLDASANEHLPNLNAAQSQIIGPVRDLLDSDAALESTVMGILLGYGLPGHYGDRPAPPSSPLPGGASLADALQDMYDDDLPIDEQDDWNLANPHLFGAILPPDGRITKAKMTSSWPGLYMVARIDAPSLEEAMALTQRAQQLADPDYSLFGEFVWYDYYDPCFPHYTGEWYWLREAVEADELVDLPWSEFDLDGIDESSETPHDAFRFDTYQLYGWQPSDFGTTHPGGRVLAWHLNSYGALTVRSTTDENGVYVPNALAAGYASAIGATGEPFTLVGPFPDTLVAALREGWTLGEAYFLANPSNDHVWTLVGDPFLTVPNWFEEVTAAFDIYGEARLRPSLRDVPAFRACLGGPGSSSPEVCAAFDLDGDGDADLADFASVQRSFADLPMRVASGDYDGDHDVDRHDFDQFRRCATPPGPAELSLPCREFDFDLDLDVDLRDFLNFQCLFRPHGDQEFVADLGEVG